MTKTEPNRSRQHALELLRLWYRKRCEDGGQRYHPDKSELTITVAPERLSGGPRPSNKKLTANGTEKHIPAPDLYPSGVATDPFAKFGHEGSDRRHAHEAYARVCMTQVYHVHEFLHRSLEMSAAKWSLDEIATELNCSVHKARTHVECGLAAIGMYRMLTKPKWQP